MRVKGTWYLAGSVCLSRWLASRLLLASGIDFPSGQVSFYYPPSWMDSKPLNPAGFSLSSQVAAGLQLLAVPKTASIPVIFLVMKTSATVLTCTYLLSFRDSFFPDILGKFFL